MRTREWKKKREMETVDGTHDTEKLSTIIRIIVNSTRTYLCTKILKANSTQVKCCENNWHPNSMRTIYAWDAIWKYATMLKWRPTMLYFAFILALTKRPFVADKVIPFYVIENGIEWNRNELLCCVSSMFLWYLVMIFYDQLNWIFSVMLMHSYWVVVQEPGG